MPSGPAARSAGCRSSMLIEAEALAAAGEPDRAAGAMERVIDAIGVDAAYDAARRRAGPR